MSENSNEVMVRNGAADLANQISQFNADNLPVFSTIQGDDFTAKVNTLSAIDNAEPISEHLGQPIDLANVVIQAVTLTDENGNDVDAPRVILIDREGNAFAGLSPSLLKAVRNLFAIVGQPASWPDGFLTVQVTEDRTRKGYKFFNLSVITKSA